jgi:UDP-3-O-[3-hydroxymyristoyl] glucosamine N-acyltransferase
VDIVRVAGIEQAGPGDLTFVANPRYHAQLRYTRASAVILGEGDRSPAPCPVLRSDNPYRTFAEAVSVFHEPVPPARGIDPLSSIAADATLGPDVSVGPFVTIGRRDDRRRTIIHPSVVIGARARVGDDCLVHSHVAIREG